MWPKTPLSRFLQISAFWKKYIYDLRKKNIHHFRLLRIREKVFWIWERFCEEMSCNFINIIITCLIDGSKGIQIRIRIMKCLVCLCFWRSNTINIVTRSFNIFIFWDISQYFGGEKGFLNFCGGSSHLHLWFDFDYEQVNKLCIFHISLTL